MAIENTPATAIPVGRFSFYLRFINANRAYGLGIVSLTGHRAFYGRNT
jgi:hypothetical protein